MKLKLLAAVVATFLTVVPAHAGTRVIDFEDFALGPIAPFTVSFDLDGVRGSWISFKGGEIVEFNGSKALRINSAPKPWGNSTFANGLTFPGSGAPNKTFLSAQFIYAEVTLDKFGFVGFTTEGRTVAAGETAIFDRPFVPGSRPAIGTYGIGFTGTPGGYGYLDNVGFEWIVATVPEPATWARLIAGFAMVGHAARRGHRARNAVRLTTG